MPFAARVPAPISDAGVASPCIAVCAIDPRSGWCVGCLRTLDEIAAWGALDDMQKRAVWKRLPQRRVDLDRLEDEPR